MEQLCEICEAAPALLKCLNCTKNKLFCAACFEFKHKIDANKSHQFEKLYQDGQPIKKLAAMANTSKNTKFVCPIHNKEREYTLQNL